MKKKDCVLLVEGEEGEGADMRSLLLAMGYQVLSCSDCARAQWFLQNQKFVCVVIDHKVRGTCGMSVVTPIKNNPGHMNHATPFILMSECLEASTLNKHAKRIDGALIKPFKQEKFVETVATVVASK